MIRERAATDLPGCVAALWPVHLADGYPIHWPPDPAAWLDPPGLTRAWVAVVDGEIVGHVGVVFQDGDQGTGPAVVTRLFITPAARGSGLAAALLDVLRADAAQAARTTVLEVIDGTEAVGLYERLGWQHLETRQSTWRARDGLHRTVRSYREPSGSSGPSGP